MSDSSAPSQRLRGRRILITGAGQGIGEAVAELFHREGAKLALLDAQADTVAKVAARTDAVPLTADVTDEVQVAAAIAHAAEAMGGIDGIVNAVGIMSSLTFAQTSLAHWRKVVDVNLTGPFIVCQAALPHLQTAGQATIVNIASVQALLPGASGASYSASKGGLTLLTKSLAAELAPSIRANVVCPGATDTAMTAAVIDALGPETRTAILNRNGAKRLATPQEIAQAILFLTSSESSYINGIALAVDGGRTFH